MLNGPVEQIIDSTPMLGAAATQDTVRLVRHGVCKLLDAVVAVDSEAAGHLDRALEFDYARPNEKPDRRWRERAERERMLTRVARDAERALRAVEQGEGLLDEAAVADARRKPGRFAKRDFRIDPAVGTVRCPAGEIAPIRTDPNGAISADTERQGSRFGHSSGRSRPRR